MQLKLVSLTLALCLCSRIYAQEKVYQQNFEKEYLTSWDSLNNSSKIYSIDPYTPKEKSSVNIASEINDAAHNKFYVESCCIDSNDLHSYFSSIILFDNKMPSKRELMVITLDNALNKNKYYSISLDLKYHPYTKYKIDSIGILFLEDKTDIQKWLKENPFNGQYLNLSLNDINNKLWKRLSGQFEAKSSYNYLIVGNLKTDEKTLINLIKHCPCKRELKGYWDYSEIYIDDISIKIVD